MKNADKDEAEEFAVDQCHKVLDRMELREAGNLSIPEPAPKPPAQDPDDGLDDLLGADDNRPPF